MGTTTTKLNHATFRKGSTIDKYFRIGGRAIHADLISAVALLVLDGGLYRANNGRAKSIGVGLEVGI
mgnify:CR=1 FL=1